MFSKKRLSLGLIYFGLSFLAAGTTTPSASAQPADDAPPSANASGGAGSRGFRHGGGAGMGHHMRFPKEDDVLGVAGLTAKQKTDIEALYKKEKSDTAPLRKQMKESMAGGASTGAGGAATASGGGRGANMELVKQMHEIRKANWEKVKALLTPAQIAVLKPSGPPGGGPGGPPAGGPAGGPNGPPGEDQ